MPRGVPKNGNVSKKNIYEVATEAEANERPCECLIHSVVTKHYKKWIEQPGLTKGLPMVDWVNESNPR